MIISTIIISGCVSNPMSNKPPSNDGIKKLDIQEIADADLYTKVDDDLGLYGINFYQTSDTSIVSIDNVIKSTNKKAKNFCGNKKRSPYLGDRVKPRTMVLAAEGDVGWFQDEYRIIFICADSAFTKDNQQLMTRFEEMTKTADESIKGELNSKFQKQQKRLDEAGAAFADGWNNGLQIQQYQTPRKTMTFCTTSVLTGQVTCY